VSSLTPGWSGLRRDLVLGWDTESIRNVAGFSRKLLSYEEDTFSADDALLEKARAVARSQRRTLHAAFREWLEQFTNKEGNVQEFDALMRQLEKVDSGRRFTRDEMNQR
jgi:predicted transcriptional regulator